jgi:hypothetical protein
MDHADIFVSAIKVVFFWLFVMLLLIVGMTQCADPVHARAKTISGFQFPVSSFQPEATQ